MAGPRDETRIDAGSLLAGIGALMLLVSLFLNWYGADDGGGGVTAWQTFELVDILLAALALAVLYALVRRATGPQSWPALPPAVAAVSGPIALVLIVVSMISDPPVLLLVPGNQLEAGAWVALAAAILISAGALLARVRISLVLSSREPRPSPARRVDPAGETETMPVDAQPPPPA